VYNGETFAVSVLPSSGIRARLSLLISRGAYASLRR